MKELEGKKLLILGAGTNELSLVERAQELGVYVIVTDYNLDHMLSPSKDVANEYWDISWSDLELLETKCRESNVDGILSGYSEIRVENNIKLCEKLNLPCYINMEQLDITRDKIKFKQTCRENGVPVIKEYSSIDVVDEFPVIVKPTDRAGSIGISIANNYDELVDAYNYAMEMSLNKTVIIEEYIHKNAKKFDAYYGIVDGNITLLGTDDVINAKNNCNKKVVQSGWVLPSVHEEDYLVSVDLSLRRMMKNMGIKNGYIFFSGFSMGNGEFCFFECGFRLCGGYLFNYFPLVGLYSNMDLLLLYSLTGDCSSVLYGRTEKKDIKNVTINVYLKAGIIQTIKGFEGIKSNPNCKFSLQECHVGQVCEDDKAILTRAGIVYFCNENSETLANDVKCFYDMLCIKDSKGNDMVYDYIDIDTIRNWWN